MPELPEVETVRRTLKNFILNQTIHSITIRYDKIIETDNDTFKKSLINETIIDINRLGKYLMLETNHYTLLIHLRMEGKFNIKNKLETVQKHDHVIFHLDDFDLRYNDTRKFGRMRLFKKGEANQYLKDHIGEEPFTIKDEELIQKAKKSNKNIKSFLLDQSNMSGIGNIYANEICFEMRIDPRSKINRLSKARILELKAISIKILNEAIEQGGTTIHSFDANGIHGLFQVKLKVHGQKRCFNCLNPIKKIQLNQRGTYYCPHCQKRRY